MVRFAISALSIVLAIASVGALGRTNGVQAGSQAKAGDAKGEVVQTVVLKKRAGNAAYDNSAFSFRYNTQDFAIHKNQVDIVYSGCGLLHVSPEIGLKNRITKVQAKSLAEVDQPPTVGWMTQCIAPEAGAFYVMDVDDGTTRMRVKLHLTTVTAGEVDFEWAPFHDSTRGTSSTMGQCTGKHAVK